MFFDQREQYIDAQEDLENVPNLDNDWLDQDEIDQPDHDDRIWSEQDFGRPPGRIKPETREPIYIPIQPPQIQEVDEEEDEVPLQEQELPVVVVEEEEEAEAVQQPEEAPLKCGGTKKILFVFKVDQDMWYVLATVQLFGVVSYNQWLP